MIKKIGLGREGQKAVILFMYQRVNLPSLIFTLVSGRKLMRHVTRRPLLTLIYWYPLTPVACNLFQDRIFHLRTTCLAISCCIVLRGVGTSLLAAGSYIKLRYEAFARILANGSAAFTESCTAIGWKIVTVSDCCNNTAAVICTEWSICFNYMVYMCFKVFYGVLIWQSL